MDYFTKIKQWQIESKKGLVCGIFGCNQPVEKKCRICKMGYCEDHKKCHFHQVSKEEENKGGLFPK